MYYGEGYWQGKGVYPGPCFFVAVLFLRFAGCRQMVCSSVRQQPRLAAVRRGSGIPPPIGFANRSPALQRADKRSFCPISKQCHLPHCPPFEGRGTMRSMVVGCLGAAQSNDPRLESTTPFVRPLKGAARRLALQRLSGRLSPCGWGPCGAWWWDA